MSEMLVAKKTFIATLDGKRVVVKAGKTRVHAGHELAAAHPEFFKPAEAQYEDVEDTTARPGRKRGTRKAAPAAAVVTHEG